MQLFEYTNDLPENNNSSPPFSLHFPELETGEELLIVQQPLPDCPSKQALCPELGTMPLYAGNPLAAGSALVTPENGLPLVRLLWRGDVPDSGSRRSIHCIRALTTQNISAGSYNLVSASQGRALAWITLSDKAASGLREDKSGPMIEKTVRETLNLRCSSGYVIPDDIHRLRALTMDLAILQGYDLIISSGGTGIAPRDNTPEALLPLLDMRLPGFEQAMLHSAMLITPRAVISRAIAGTIANSILITLPGSSKAITENLQPLLPALEHALEKLQGSNKDCGG